MRLNSNAVTAPIYTHEGGRAAAHLTPLQLLRRSVMACLLWEDSFYESGQNIAERIKSLVSQCDIKDVAELAIEAREEMKMRHAPLLIVREMARRKGAGAIVGRTLTRVIQRADELGEFLSIYWADGPDQPVCKQVRLGLAGAFRKFDAYQFAKYDRDTVVKLRDALFISHAKPKDIDRQYTRVDRAAERAVGVEPVLTANERLYRQIADRSLPIPDTWEVALSGGQDKRATFERLLAENKLGYLALLRNLRNMAESGVPETAIRDRLLEGAAKSKALPFRFVAAARATPQFEPMIDHAMVLALAGLPKLSGSTHVLVDVSISMNHKLSTKSDLSRLDAAAALAVLISGISDRVRVFTFSDEVAEVPPRSGMALIDAIRFSQIQRGTRLGSAVATINAHAVDYDRLVVITDEQSSDTVGAPKNRGYMINVASDQNGVGYSVWTHIDGFSESVVRFIQQLEADAAAPVAADVVSED